MKTCATINVTSVTIITYLYITAFVLSTKNSSYKDSLTPTAENQYQTWCLAHSITVSGKMQLKKLLRQ